MYITKLIKGERISRQVQEHRPVHVDLLLLYYGYVMICAFKENSIIWGIQLKDWRCMFWKTCAQHVSARGKSAWPRATCDRRARSLGSWKPLLGGLGVSVWVFCAAGRRPRPLMVESIAHFERRSHDWRGSGSKGVAEEPLRGCLNSKPWKPNPNPLRTRRGP